MAVPDTTAGRMGKFFRQYDKAIRDIWETYHVTDAALATIHDLLSQKRLQPFPRPSLGGGPDRRFGRGDLYGALTHIRSTANASRALVFSVSATEDFLRYVIGQVVRDEPKRLLTQAQLAAGPTTAEVEKAVSVLFRGSIPNLLRENKHQLGFGGLFAGPFTKRVDQYSEINARRNVWMHNEGKVDALYMKLVPGSPLKVGDRATMTSGYIREALFVLRGLSAVAAAHVCASVYNDPIRGGKIGRHARGFAP